MAGTKNLETTTMINDNDNRSTMNAPKPGMKSLTAVQAAAIKLAEEKTKAHNAAVETEAVHS